MPLLFKSRKSSEQYVTYLPSREHLALFFRHPEEEAALELLWVNRVGAGPIICPQCKLPSSFTLEDKIYHCQYHFCDQQLDPIKGTVFAQSLISLRRWYILLDAILENRNLTITAASRKIGVSYMTAQKMVKKIKDELAHVER